MTDGTTPPYRSGFLTFVGRPNVGKSTLMNALVGQKVAITSPKPQTTRRAIRGIVTRPAGQLVVVDTPGMHRPRTLLGERLNDVVATTLSDVDVVGFCVPAGEPIGPGDRFLHARLDDAPRAKRIAIVTKIDAVPKDRVVAQLMAVDALGDWASVIPVSAQDGVQLDVLVAEALALMPEGPALYDVEAVTDETLEQRIAELIREAALEGAREELPHSLAVTVDDIEEQEGMTRIFANVWVERDSQRIIMIGRKGARLKEVGTAARAQIEPLVGTKVFLALHVKVAKEWQRDPKQLGRLGF
ncbi:GTPase Era [uncultured Amnibacterium sp.]|uniref:GTPase Era n=1 Tax=uncultured Amnibacterium sp. TaxID=1631851 RepID=UPI0035C9A4C7